MWADGRTDGRTERQADRHDDANTPFSQFCEGTAGTRSVSKARCVCLRSRLGIHWLLAGAEEHDGDAKQIPLGSSQ
jgi:hypothetical protein